MIGASGAHTAVPTMGGSRAHYRGAWVSIIKGCCGHYRGSIMRHRGSVPNIEGSGAHERGFRCPHLSCAATPRCSGAT